MNFLPNPLPERAWQIDRQIRLNAIPLDRRSHPSQWYDSQTVFPTGDDLMLLFWNATVPGSGAPEIPYIEMVQSMHNRGFDVSAAEALLPEGLRLAAAGQRDSLRALTAQLLANLHASPRIPNHPYWTFTHPAGWDAVAAAMDHPQLVTYPGASDQLEERILQGWIGQLAGGAFGTAIEGYHSRRIAEVYGEIRGYITRPETVNDDVVYELVFLAVFEQLGRGLTSSRLALEWVRQIPFGWSAEGVALENLKLGILPPESGSFRNPYHDWIGAQMRGMICGLLSPGNPFEAARLAHLDGVISHAANGVYGELYASALTALAFSIRDERALLAEASRYLPRGSEYASVLKEILAVVSSNQNPVQAWEILDRRFEEYNWIHAYPNLAADVLALWYCQGDFGEAMRWLAHAGLDVDCNAGLVGTVLGIQHDVPAEWADPIGDLLETYLKGKERLSIRALAKRTAAAAQM